MNAELGGWQLNKSIMFAVMFGLVLAVFSTAAHAVRFTVNSFLDQQDADEGNGVCATASGTCTLRAAITEANALAGADQITLPAGVYTTTLAFPNEDGNRGGDFDINSDITIGGAGATQTIVQAATSAGVATERVFHINFVAPGTTAILNQMTIRHGRYTDASVGSGVRIEGGAVVATFNGVHIVNNENARYGGGLAIFSAENSITTLNACRIENNAVDGASVRGAGIFFSNISASMNINDSVITGNTAAAVSNAIAAGIYSQGNLNITNSEVSNNISTSSDLNSFGGGIGTLDGTLAILASTISGNASTATSESGFGIAGGIYNQNATLNLTDSVVSGNTASHSGGGIRTSSSGATTNITNSVIGNNVSMLDGGGVVNISGSSGPVTTNIINSTVSANSANGPTSKGGGIQNVSASSGLAIVTVTNSTISGNTAASGAGSYNVGAASSINFIYSTLAGNAASNDGGGIFQDSSGVTNLKNSIVADNAAPGGPDISGVVTSQGFNHVENIFGATFAPHGGDVIGSDPQLGPLDNNGGSTLTHLPAPTSPVINAIPNGLSDCGVAVTSSQNEIVRPQESGCEKGSVEVGEASLFRDGFDGA